MIATCYARVSTEDQAKDRKVSIPTQISWAKELAKKKGWIWRDEYIEPGITGDTEIEDRDSLNMAVEDGKNNKYDVLLIYHSSRLSREPDIGMKVCRVLGQRKVQVYMKNAPIEIIEPKEDFAWGENVGAKYMTAFTLIGDFGDNVKRGESSKIGNENLAKMGILRNAPFGYKKIMEFKVVDGKKVYAWHFEIDEEKAIFVRKIFDLYISPGGSIRKVMLSLNNDKIATPTGIISGWTTATVKSILNNPAYIGLIRWGRKLGSKFKEGKTITNKTKRVITPREKWILVKGNFESIINPNDFEKVQDKLKTRGILHGRASASIGLLTGLLKCGRCSRNAYYKTRPSKKDKSIRRGYYACSTYYRSNNCQCYVISANTIHSLVFDEISKLAKDKKYRKTILEKESVSINKKEMTKLEILKKAKIDIDNKAKRTLQLYQNSLMTLEDYGQAILPLNNEIISINKEIEKIEVDINDASRSKIKQERFVSIIKKFDQKIINAPQETQKEFLQSVLESVVVRGRNIKINYRLF
ncbi:MAG TPA: recombinase family protein [Candidatus Woesebacteria bacterium]|nr:recombinase family protein [Candidatus Woesebacteria bacterium]